ncbi:MAG: DUF4438 domain-containing protein [Chloroflexota bacterium]
MPVATNAALLVRTRLVAPVGQASLNVVATPDGGVVGLPGQGGLVAGVGLGDRAGGWSADHLEPGASLRHPDAAADRALQVLACVGNTATVVDGPAAGARGVVYGKHGALLVAFAPDATDRLAPGERVAIDALGVGLAIDGEPEIAVHSCDPALLDALVTGRDAAGRLVVPVRAILPIEAAGAGIGMSALRFDIDVLVDEPPVAELAADLRFGDVIAIADQDHRFLRTTRPGFVAIGIVCHGRSAGGGHGFGMVTLLSGPAARFALPLDDGARLGRLVPLPWVAP